ncbi:MAG: tRNA (adenosine(37)-N6)-threonylcarbamoyltransferase complex transferase subunit TsaD [Bdellovibrionales bacterium]|nr:tRNA (adenosine(37)-N6)-threonylcarbamoyltransferase complex transferase subunit TsaD [Bdellovibrionales bacterium]
MSFEYVLAIETSCDDTSVAIVRQDGYVVECLAANQDLVHQPFGGVVPEIASRNHTLQILPLVEKVLEKSEFTIDKIDGLAVTSRPGLIGSLLVGVVTAKTLALIHDRPLIGVNHLEAHLLAPFLYDDEFSKPQDLKFPYLALAISGGHTQLYLVHDFGQYEVLGRTVDDAAGEAFDKFAKRLGLSFPGGVQVDRLAKDGDKNKYALPRTMVHEDSYNFSFSGLKSAATRLVDSLSDSERLSERAHLCASFQEAVVESLMYKLNKAAQELSISRVVLTGGVSANSRLREVSEAWAKKNKITLFVPPIRYCTDNAAMVGFAGVQRLIKGESSDQNLSASASSLPSDFKEASR